MPRIIYRPPSLKIIGELVNEVFDRHSAEHPVYRNLEIRQGFIQFLAVSASILAKHLSETEENTNWIDTEEK